MLSKEDGTSNWCLNYMVDFHDCLGLLARGLIVSNDTNMMLFKLAMLLTSAE